LRAAILPGGAAYSVAVGDFNLDGIPDLVIGASPYISILLGIGDNSNVVLVVDPVSLATIATLSLPGTPTSDYVSGTTLLVGMQSGELLYFDTRTLKQTNSVAGPQSNAIFAVSPNGAKISMSSLAGETTANVLDFSTGAVLQSQAFPSLTVTNLLLSPDGTQIVAASEPVALINAASLTLTKTIEVVGAPNAAVWLNTNTLLMLNPATNVAVIDQSGNLQGLLPVGQSAGGEVADAKRGVVYLGTGSVPEVINAKLDRVSASLPAPTGFIPGAVIDDQLYGSGPAVFNLKTLQTTYLKPPHLPSGYYLFSLSGAAPPDGKTFWAPYVGIEEYGGLGYIDINVYDTATNNLVAHLQPPFGNSPIVFSPDSSTAYVGSTYAGMIVVYDTHTFTSTNTFSFPTLFNMGLLAISPDGSTLYGELAVSLRDGREVERLR